MRELPERVLRRYASQQGIEPEELRRCIEESSRRYRKPFDYKHCPVFRVDLKPTAKNRNLGYILIPQSWFKESK